MKHWFFCYRLMAILRNLIRLMVTTSNEDVLFGRYGLVVCPVARVISSVQVTGVGDGQHWIIRHWTVAISFSQCGHDSPSKTLHLINNNSNRLWNNRKIWFELHWPCRSRCLGKMKVIASWRSIDEWQSNQLCTSNWMWNRSEISKTDGQLAGFSAGILFHLSSCHLSLLSLHTTQKIT